MTQVEELMEMIILLTCLILCLMLAYYKNLVRLFIMGKLLIGLLGILMLLYFHFLKLIILKVPLFLPIYGFSRLYDLRKIAFQEIALKRKIDGQINFESGWEW